VHGDRAPPYPIAVCAPPPRTRRESNADDQLLAQGLAVPLVRAAGAARHDGAWIHAHLAYVCRDRSGALAATTAEPEVSRRAL
jgi:hypothetical protein